MGSLLSIYQTKEFCQAHNPHLIHSQNLMNSEETNYISLQEATKFCNYSQEYLALRARQGRLKSAKFGRNWVTKKEWLEEYLTEVEEYNNQLGKVKKVEPPAELEKVIDVDVRRQHQPVLLVRFGFVTFLQQKLKEPALRLGFATTLVFVLLIGGIVFGQESFKNVYEALDPYVIKISQAVDESFALISTFASFGSSVSDLAAKEIVDEAKDFYSQIFAESGQSFVSVGKELNSFVQEFSEYTYILGGVARDIVTAEVGEVTVSFKGYFQWLRDSYLAANDWLERKISEDVDNLVSGIKYLTFRVKQGYLAANEFVEEKLNQGYQAITQPFVKTYQFVTQPRKVLPPEKAAIEETGVEKIIEALRKEIRDQFQELKEEGVPVKETIKEVTKITRVEPVKEITKEVIKIDEKELAKLKIQVSQISLWGTDIENLREITKRLQATPAYTVAPSAPIYIGYQGLQVGGSGNFESLGVSGSAGIRNLGVGGSTSLGGTAADTLTVNAISFFKAPVTFGTSTLTIDTLGNLTTTGNITTTGTGNLTVAGDVTISGALTTSGTTALTAPQIITTTTAPQLSVKYDGSNKLDISVSSNGVITLDSSSGEIRLASGDTLYTSGGNPIRAAGEEIFQVAVPIFRYSMPSQTNSTTFIRVSKYFANTSDISLPAALTGTTRVYRLVISYADDIATANNSDWRIVNQAGASTYATFTLPGQNLATFEEGKSYLTGLVTIPDTDWQVEVKAPTGKTIRIFQIYLIAYDEIQ